MNLIKVVSLLIFGSDVDNDEIKLGISIWDFES